MYYHRIEEQDYQERYVLSPFTKDGRVQGFCITIRTRFWQLFLTENRDWDSEILEKIKAQWGIRFTKLAPPLLTGSRFGFEKGLQVGELGAREMNLYVLFPKTKKNDRYFYSPALNLHWLLDFLFHLGPAHDRQKGTPQLFEINTGISMESNNHGFPVSVHVGKGCAALLESTGKNIDFPMAREAITGTYRRYGLRTHASYMQACIRYKGILMLSAGGSCNCLGTNPDERILPYGYSMYSHNTDSPIHQITLLMGLAQIWTEIREKMAAQT